MTKLGHGCKNSIEDSKVLCTCETLPYYQHHAPKFSYEHEEGALD